MDHDIPTLSLGRFHFVLRVGIHDTNSTRLGSGKESHDEEQIELNNIIMFLD